MTTTALDQVVAGPVDGVLLAACPSCHTTNSTMTSGALAAGAGWRCARCGQQWTASRLATVAAYAAWVTAGEIVTDLRPSDGHAR